MPEIIGGEFNEFLKKNDWVKLENVDTVRYRKYGYQQPQSYIIADSLEKFMLEVAKEFFPASIYYVAQIGNAAPLECRVVNTNTGYKIVKQ
ncbi:hypothetical protein HX870_16280 [Pseudomonas gingeri]|uniref:hypothetical protein n=1 Tax=Pseudomonas gingeri TaxID=117681 RepID=UPI0015A0AA71|nr:hypothetical protein [Pseudomonas gingeri]NWD69161.1 hypothetical protein [Pseudomonas gingeri]